jgi:hypothetical protein
LWRPILICIEFGVDSAEAVIEKSTEEFGKSTTGSDWHCAWGNIWFGYIDK